MTAMAARTNVRTFSTGNPASLGTNDFFTPNGPGSSPATAPSAAGFSAASAPCQPGYTGVLIRNRNSLTLSKLTILCYYANY